MALSFTVEEFINSGDWTNGVESFSFSAFTPANNSLLLVLVALVDNAETGLAGYTRVSDTETNTWTIDDSANGPSAYQAQGAIFHTEISTGTSMTITVDFDWTGSASAGSYTAALIEITGHDTITPIGGTAAAYNQNGDGAESLTLDATPDTYSYVFALAHVDGDSGGTFGVTPGSGWTEDNEVGSSTVSLSVGQLQHRTGSTSTSVDWADMQTGTMTTYGSGLVAIEVKAPPPPVEFSASITAASATPTDVTISFGPQFVDAEESRENSSASLTMTLPTHAQNDLLIAFVGRGESGDPENWNDDGGDSNGWTRLVNNHTSTGRDIETAVYSKIAGASESNPKFTHGGAGAYDLSGTIVAYRAVNTTTPFDVVYNNSNHFNSEVDSPDPTPSAATVVSDDSVTVLFSFANYGEITAIGAPTNYTLRSYDIAINENIMLAERQTDTGTETPGSWNNTYSASSAEAHSYTLVIRAEGVTGDTVDFSAAVAVASTTPGDVALTLSLQFSAAIAAASATPDTVTIATAAAIEFSASIAVSSATPTDTLVLVPSGACTNGVLTVNSTNGRYFENDDGPLILAGHHTWYSLQDGGGTNPPSAFGWTAFLSDIVTRGGNFTKLWAMETMRGWSDDTDQWFTPVRYVRTGPGNAADGYLKVDVSRPNPELLKRLRRRAIDAGANDVYVCIQFFQGWQNETNKGGTGDPVSYHPMLDGNNINSVDGDYNDDGDLLEIHTDTNNAAWAYQQDLIEAIIDELNDLDNVFWEVSNEDTPSTGNTDWQADIISHISTYEAGKPKQHIIGMTKQYPGGSDSTLDSSSADWVSYSATKADAVHSASDPVSFYDTDHTVGLTSAHAWILTSFAEGHGGAWYMDEWDGALYGSDRRSDTDYQLIRDVLGYMRAFSEKMDLENCEPSASLSDTGFCLANTTDGEGELFIYQSGSGDIDVTLTGFSGEFTVEWQRISDGTTQAGSNTTGGAVRTLSPPWAGDVILYLRQVVSFSASIAVSSATPDDAAVSTSINFGASIAAGSATSDTASLSVHMQFTASIAVSSATPEDTAVALAIEHSATIAAASATPDDVTLVIEGTITFGASIAVVSATPAVSLDQALAFGAAIAAASTTPAVSLDVGGTVVLDANIAVTSATPNNTAVALAIEHSAVIAAVSATPDDVTLSAPKTLGASIAAGSATADTVSITIAHSLAASIGALSTTPEIGLSLLIRLAAAVSAQSATPAVALSVGDAAFNPPGVINVAPSGTTLVDGNDTIDLRY